MPIVLRSGRRFRAILAKGPAHLYHLGHARLAQAGQRLLGRWSPAAVDEAACLRQLRLPAGAPPSDRAAVARHFRSRAQPALGPDPGRAAVILERAEPLARSKTLAAAEAVCRGEFHFRGQPPVVFGERVDWGHCPDGNTDWTWELNRQAYLATLGRAHAYTGDARYVAAFRRLLRDWLACNPPGLDAPAWSSALEVACRLNHWAWAWHFFRAALDDDDLLACLRGLWLHARFLAANLEYTSPNNHLLLEAKALALAGLLFPEFRAARAWRGRGLAVLWREVRRQVRPDGVHAEQSTLYQQIIASELLELLVVLDAHGQAAPADIRERFARMLAFERAVTKPDGEIPLIGDSALGDSYVRFNALAGGAALLGRPDLAAGPLDDATVWLLGPERAARLPAAPAPPPESQAFPAGGYAVMRAGQGASAAYLVFDCGPFGYPPAPGHGHADALSFELFAAGRTLVVDPGVYSYHLGAAWRNYFRGTSAHNTLVVDGQDQSVLVGEWHVLRPAPVVWQDWLTTPELDLVVGSQAGYARLPQPVTHTRCLVFVKPEYWILVDWLTGRGEHRLDLLFHFMPGAVATSEPGSGVVRVADGEAGLALAPAPGWPAEICAGAEAPIQGWVSRRSGEKAPAPVACFSRVARAPAAFAAALIPHRAGAAVEARVEWLSVQDAHGRALAGPDVLGLRVTGAGWSDDLVLDRRAAPGPKVFGDCASAAAVVYLRRGPDGGLQKTVLPRGGALTQRAGR